MGSRANIVFRHADATGIFLYSHHEGPWLAKALLDVFQHSDVVEERLELGNAPREYALLDVESDLVGAVFDRMRYLLLGDEQLLGHATVLRVSTKLVDNDWSFTVVDVNKMSVKIYDPAASGSMWHILQGTPKSQTWMQRSWTFPDYKALSYEKDIRPILKQAE